MPAKFKGGLVCGAHLVPEEPGPAPAGAVIAGREAEGRVDVGEGALALQLSPDATRLGPELIGRLRVTGDAQDADSHGLLACKQWINI